MTISTPESSYPTVGDFVLSICAKDGVTAVNTDALSTISMRGFVVAGVYNGADTIRSLQSAYFFDFPEIDGQLVAVLRGAAVVAVIPKADMVLGSEAEFETAREQNVEFPRKVHVNYANAESDYTQTKQTAERRSIDIKSLSEISVELPINLVDDDALQIADKIQKTAWIEAEGRVKFAVSEEYAYLVPSDNVSVEVDSGVFKRIRIQEMMFVAGAIHIDAVIDRASVYSSALTAAPVVDPIDPSTNLPGDTAFEVMDLPALTQNHDTLHAYVAAHGTNAGWSGATVEQLIDTEWIELETVTYPSSIGALLEALPDHPRGLDTTNDVLVSLSDDDIATITQAEFDAGGNAALIENEIINFRDVVAEGDNWRISHFTRGALNTTTELHAIASRFVKLVAPTRVPIDASFIGSSVTLRVYSFGTIPDAGDEETFTFNGTSQIEFPPLTPTAELLTGDWSFDWTHNKRIGAPSSAVASVHFVNFGVRLTKGATTITLFTDGESITYTDAEQIEDFGVAVTSWDTAVVFGVNEYTGEGVESTFADITGFKRKLESGGYLMLEGHSGAIGLE